MFSIGANKLKKKIEAMQDTVCILEIQINTKLYKAVMKWRNNIETIFFYKVLA